MSVIQGVLCHYIIQSKRKEAIHCQHTIRVAYNLIRPLLQRVAVHLCIKKKFCSAVNCDALLVHSRILASSGHIEQKLAAHAAVCRLLKGKSFQSSQVWIPAISTDATYSNSHTMLTLKSSQCEYSKNAGVHPHVKNNIATKVFRTETLSFSVTESLSFLLPSLAISAQEGLIRHMLTHKSLECGVKFKYTETFHLFFLPKSLWL